MNVKSNNKTQQVIEEADHDLAILVLKDFIIRQKEQLSSVRRSSQKAYPNAKQAQTVLRAVRNLEEGIASVEKSIQALTLYDQEQSQPVPDKTKEEILTECTNWPFQSISESPYTCNIKADQALKAMQLYSDQNTAPLLARIRELEEEIERRQNYIDEYENRESSVCPEDMGCDEYIPILQKKIAGLESELSATNIRMGELQDEMEMKDARIRELEGENKKLKRWTDKAQKHLTPEQLSWISWFANPRNQ